MAVQTTPHTETEQDVNPAQPDREPNKNPQETLPADPKLYEHTDGAQTAGNRSFHANAGHDNQPKSIDEGTGLTESRHAQVPTDDGHGITNSSGSKERETQEKVLGK